MLLYISTILLLTSDVLNYSGFGKLFKLIPLAYGNDLLRRSVSNIIIPNMLWIKYIILCISVLSIGILTFNYMIKKAKIKGVLLHY